MVERAGLAAALTIGMVCAMPAFADDAASWRVMALERAAKEATQIDDPYRRAEVVADLARAQTSIDDATAMDRSVRAALSAAREIIEPTLQGWVLHEVVQAQLLANDLAGARQTALNIRALRPRGAALAAIAEVQLRGGNLDAALATAMRIADEESSGVTLRQLVAAHAARGELAAARQLLREIDDDYYRALAAGDVVVAEVRAGNVQAASDAAADSPRAYRAIAYERLAVALADKNDVTTALTIMSKIDSPIDRALVQARIAARRAAADERTQAREMFAAAVIALDKAPEKSRDKPEHKAEAWAQLARLQALAGETADARETVIRATAAIDALLPGPRRDQVRDVLARSQLRMGDSEAALVSAARIDDRVTQALLIRDVVAAQADSGDAGSLLRHPIVAKDSLTQAAALFGAIGVQLLRKEQVRSRPESVAANIDAARVAVRSIDDLQVRPAAFAALAAARATFDDGDVARAMFDDALAAAAALGRPRERAAAYVRVVNALDERLLFLGQPANRETP